MVPEYSITGGGVLNGVQNPVSTAFAEAWHGLFRVGRALAATAAVWRAHLLGMDTRDEPLIMTGEQVAELLQVSPRTIEEWRQTNSGPPFCRVDAMCATCAPKCSPGSRSWCAMARPRLEPGEIGAIRCAPSRPDACRPPRRCGTRSASYAA